MFWLLWDRVNAKGCEAAVTARERIGWMKFKECGELLNSRESHGESNVWCKKRGQGT